MTAVDALRGGRDFKATARPVAVAAALSNVGSDDFAEKGLDGKTRLGAPFDRDGKGTAEAADDRVTVRSIELDETTE